MNSQQLTLLSGLTQICREQQSSIERLELALETLLNCPALDWKDTVKAVQEDLHAHGNDSTTSSTLASLDSAIQQLRRMLDDSRKTQ